MHWHGWMVAYVVLLCIAITVMLSVGILMFVRLYAALFISPRQQKRFEAKLLARGFQAASEASFQKAWDEIEGDLRLLKSGMRREFSDIWRAEMDGCQVWTCALTYHLPGSRGAVKPNRLLFLIIDPGVSCDHPYLSFEKDCPIHREYDSSKLSFKESEAITFLPNFSSDLPLKEGIFKTFPNQEEAVLSELTFEMAKGLFAADVSYCMEAQGRVLVVSYRLDDNWPVKTGDRFDELLNHPLRTSFSLHPRRNVGGPLVEDSPFTPLLQRLNGR
jgi:hypothetical protein